MSTVLVTGAGGAATPAMICDLQLAGHRVIACDMDPYAAGLWTADKGCVIPGGRAAEFGSALRHICQTEHVDVLIPLVDEELLPCWDAGIHAQIILPQRRFVELCLDKLRVMHVLRRHGLPVPETRWATDEAWDLFPAVLKPNVGRGSRGVQYVNSVSELRAAWLSTPYPQEQLLLQQRITGTEYTVSVVSWRDGQTLAVVPKEVIDKRGITRQAVTRHVPAIDAVCRKIQSELRADGPFNVQLILDADGVPWVFELNPRFSSSTSLTVAAGVDEVTGLVDLATGGAWRGGDFAEGFVMVRQTLDVIMPESEYLGRRIERA